MLGILPTLLTYTADCSLEKQVNNHDSKTNIIFILADDGSRSRLESIQYRIKILDAFWIDSRINPF